ncbi:unnamed protein product (macronuclear) [Paramecium tetraurelia]|uniref:PH domain-containing protein n=1 Tax=Paramecium tetraurelia TaxID=5888 RepID=A0CDK2_PARTE|nr:uncharacterized protein GSPATT00007080001 [Paramecium tetraurelia]CAK68869.1 unnamed protein product [Paramecium tetraurelia]|eukprot:XP_001436266.1 hypothetical protein (macronuclear) [Paramecium tetraurelia strain d4-2]
MLKKQQYIIYFYIQNHNRSFFQFRSEQLIETSWIIQLTQFLQSLFLQNNWICILNQIYLNSSRIRTIIGVQVQ